MPSDYDHSTATSALVIGESLIDIVTTPGEDGSATTDEHPGGSPANVALGLSRLGHDVELVTSFGADPNGQKIRSHLEGSEVRIGKGSAGAARTSTATADVDDSGTASYTFDLVWDPPAPDPDRTPVVLHTGSLAAVLEPGAGVVRQSVEAYRGRSTISYDPNVRPSLMGDAAGTRARVEELVALADVVKVSAEDLDWLAPGEDHAEVAKAWVARGAGLVILTRGEEGAWAVTAGGGQAAVPGPAVEVADTVGAGDAFMAGVLDGLWQAGLLGPEHREDLRGIDPETLREVLERAAKVAAITVSRPGANPPYRAELL
ncbi:carbohydrate kinase [Georgenia sp. 10Sc9-8]|uniref:Carbohydrate kinase n=1 Tax=Georgenia halotolerans TaxID=3028317 RepID=A0ABT5U1B2_9MICO|nr:carbohydrate kinase [Georgenia halotolerans]